MAFQLPSLPYAPAALEPYVSGRTLELHRNKHHQGYLNTLNGLVEATPLASLSLENVIQEVATDPSRRGIFNNAAQVWNHSFYWDSLSPQGGDEPQNGPLKALICQKWGNIETFQDHFKKVALGQFGSGWVWLILSSQGDPEIVGTSNADLPLIRGQKALLTCDVWEHAYYLDYQNRRLDYVQIFLDHLVNWRFAEIQLAN